MIETTYTSIGRALSTWEWFEGHLAVAFRYFIRAPDPNNFAPLRAYGSVMAFGGRMDMIKAAADAYLAQTPNPEIEGALAVVYSKAIKFGPRRNEIAHGMVQPYDDGQGHDSGYVLSASYYATNKRKVAALPTFRTMPTYEYSSVEIDAFERGFWGLYNDAVTLITLLASDATG
jgi:hypothetical protein